MSLSKLTVPTVMATCQPPSADGVATAVIVGPGAIRRSSSRVVQHQATSFRKEGGRGKTETRAIEKMMMMWTMVWTQRQERSGACPRSVRESSRQLQHGMRNEYRREQAKREKERDGTVFKSYRKKMKNG